MKNTPNVDAIMAIDNTNFKCEFKSRVEDKILFGTGVRCFFFDFSAMRRPTPDF